MPAHLPKRRRLAAALCAGLGVSACGIFDRSPPPPCPPVGILGDASQLTRFRPGEGRDLTDVVYDAEILGFDASCSYVDDGRTVDMTVAVRLLASRGPAAEDRQVAVPYFVAVVDRASQRVLGKATFDAAVAFPEGRRRAGAVEEIAQRIPVPEGRAGADYEVLVGLQLTDAELEFNRGRQVR